MSKNIMFPKIFNRSSNKINISNIDIINTKLSLISWFSTNNGEMFGDSKYGTKIKNHLFELDTDSNINAIKLTILEEINKNFKNIKTNEELIKIFTNNRGKYKILIGYYTELDDLQEVTIEI